MHKFITTIGLGLAIFCAWLSILSSATLAADPEFAAELIFPLNDQHNHAPGIVACPNGDLFATWYRGAGERRADDVAVYAAWKKKGESEWESYVNYERYERYE